MKKYLDIYLDLETPGAVPSSGFWELGALFADGDKLVSELLVNTACKPFTDDTKSWAKMQGIWPRFLGSRKGAMSQEAAIRLYIGEAQAVARAVGATHFRVFTWGQFDCPIMNEVVAGLDLDFPHHYRDEIDLRSVARFFGIRDRPNTSHNALEDARALFEFRVRNWPGHSAPEQPTTEQAGGN